MINNQWKEMIEDIEELTAVSHGCGSCAVCGEYIVTATATRNIVDGRLIFTEMTHHTSRISTTPVSPIAL